MSKMKKKRRIFFYLLAGVFILAAPVVIAYSFGYRFDFVKGSVERTGGIFVKSKTPRLSIFLNGAFMKETSFISGGAILPNVAPGTHLLRIEKEDHTPWSKAIAVRPELVTEMRNILLLPNPVISATTTKTLVPTEKPQTSPYKLDKKGNLVRKSLPNKALVSNVHSFGTYGNGVLFVDRNGFLAEYNPESSAVETIGRPGFFLKAELFQFVESPAGDMVIIDPSGGLFLLDAQKNLLAIGGGVKKIYFDETGEKALFLKENEVEIFWMKDSIYQPFEKRGVREVVLSFGSGISDARWFFGDNAHIAVNADNGLYFTEIDGRGGRNTVELISEKVAEIITSPEVPSAIFYRSGKNYYRIELQ